MASLKAFRVVGEFKMGSSMNKFSLETIGEDEAAARERVFSTLGSQHRTDRRHVRIASVTEIPADEVENAVVKYRLAQGA